MIPIIYDNPILTGNGYGRMADAISCTVTHEINGQFELAMEYPVTGQHYDRIEAGMVLFAAPDPVTAEQPFRIYRVTRPLNGVVTVYARHIAYDMSGISVLPFTASSLSEAFSLLPSKCVPSCPFTFATTRSVASRISTSTPMPLWSLLGGVAGSFLDVYGGEWDFNGLTASLPSSLGQDNGVSVRYGKNMTELEQDITVESTWAAVLPFWYNEETGQLVKTDQPVPVQGAFGSRVLTLDLSEEWEEAPTVAQLTARTEQYITANRIGEPQVAWKVNMAMLDQSEEYKGLAILERVQLGDTVTVIYEPYGIDVKARAVMIEYDVLAERYKNITLGRVKQNLAKIVASTPAEITAAVNAAKSALEKAIDSSTDFITHGAGYMRFIYNDDKVLQEIVSLDNPDINQARSVWRWNNGGFGHSSTGYAGPYTVAMTQDGAIVADFITAGTLSGDRVRTGIITDVSGRNYWNLNTGEWKNVAIETTLENLQEQIDNNIETFTGPAVPTLTNYPANAWTTTEEKDKHIGDLYVVNSQGGDYEGFYYRFEKTGSTYQWRLLKDTEVTKALADAEEALRRVGIAETQIEQNAEAITLRATKTEAQGYANTAQANAISAAATDATTKANAAESAAKTYADAQITVSADAITSNVSATYETKSDSATKLNTAKTYAEGQASAAERGAKNYTDGKLTDYSTTVQMNSAINQTASNITSTVSATYETKADATTKLDTAKTYAENKAAAAEDAANEYTDGKLTDYSTTVQMNSAIEQTASNITSTVSATYETKSDATTKLNTAKTYADGKAATAESNAKTAAQGYADAAEEAANDYTDGKLVDYSTTTQMESAISQSASDITSTVSATYETKAAATKKLNTAKSYAETQAADAEAAAISTAAADATTKANAAEAGAKGYTDNKLTGYSTTTQMNSAISQSAGSILQTVSETYTTKTEFGGLEDDVEAVETRVSSAESTLEVQAGQIASKVSETDYNGNTIASKINQNATTVKINAAKIDLQGAVTISDFDSAAQAALVKNTTTKNQYAQSASRTTAPTSGWQDTIPAYNATNKYIWLRVATTKTFADNTSSTTYSTPVVDVNLTKSIQDAATAQSTATGAATAASTAQTTANNAASAASTAQTKANAALVTSVSVYFRASTSTVPGKPTAEVTSTAVDTSDAWTLCMPRPKKGTTYYTCEQNKDGNGTVSWTAVRQMANTTYVAGWAMANNATYIDGASIYTGSITADQIAAGTITISNLDQDAQSEIEKAQEALTAAGTAQDTADGAVANAAVVNILPTAYYREAVTSNPYVSNGITWTVNPDGSITATGTATAASYYGVSGATTTSAVPVLCIDQTKKYTLSGVPAGGSTSTYHAQLRVTPPGVTPSTSSGTRYNDTGSGVTAPAGNAYAYVSLVISSGFDCGDGLTFYPMLEAGDTKHGYVSTHDGTGAVTAKADAAQSTANGAATAAAAAQTKADAALVQSVSVYYRSTTNSTPAKPSTAVTSTAVNTDNTWTLAMPRPKKGTYYYTCEQNTDGLGNVTWTAVRQMANATYVAGWASSTNATYIDGANIYTGTVTADKIAANEVLTQKLTATDFTITGGSINITTNSGTDDVIILNNDTESVFISPRKIRLQTSSPNYAGIALDGNLGVIVLQRTTGESVWLTAPAGSSPQLSLQGPNTGDTSVSHLSNSELYMVDKKNGATYAYKRLSLDISGLTFRDASNNVMATYPDTGLGVTSLNNVYAENINVSGTTKTYDLNNGTWLLFMVKIGGTVNTKAGMWICSPHDKNPYVTPVLAPASEAPTITMTGTTLSVTTAGGYYRLSLIKISP